MRARRGDGPLDGEVGMNRPENGARPELRELAFCDDLSRCIPVMRELRKDLEADDAVVAERIRRQMTQGYRLLVLMAGEDVVALAGFRLQENLVFGRFLYVDDLVVAPEVRGKGYAELLLDAIRGVAMDTGQALIALDTALANDIAQRVYRRCGYESVAYRLVRRFPAHSRANGDEARRTKRV